ncbi:MAG: NAD(P)-binding domain-containing protein, partial [bacterium]|nr:NAD(P)-binding domain-containing protein [bacterium]
MDEKSIYQIGVLGAGSWGMALALVLDYNQHRVTIWEYRTEAAKKLSRDRDASEFLAGITLPNTILVENNLEAACQGKDVLIVAVPSHIVRSVAEKLNDISLNSEIIIVNVAKGIENQSLMRMS